jgi:hypothetical protein
MDGGCVYQPPTEWISFSSTRRYGLRPPPAGTNGTLIWMAGVEPHKEADGEDPSYPAFAIPYQDYTTSNHIAQWTTGNGEPQECGDGQCNDDECDTCPGDCEPSECSKCGNHVCDFTECNTCPADCEPSECS